MSGRRPSFGEMLIERKAKRASRSLDEAPGTREPTLRDHPVYAKYFKMSGMMSKAEITLKMMQDGLDPKILDMDPDKPFVDPNAPAQPEDSPEDDDTCSPKTRRGVRAIFDVFDTRKEGMLSTVTLGAAFHKLGVKYKPDLVKLAMEEFDVDGNGMLDFGEFMELLSMMQTSSELRPETPPKLHKFNDTDVKKLRRSFDDIDKDGGGTLDREEIVEATKQFGIDDVSEEDVRAMLEKFDTNGDGIMDFEEFLTMMSALDASRDGRNGAAEGIARGADQIQSLVRENLKRAHEKGRKSARVRQVGVSAALNKFESDDAITPEDAAETAAAATKAAGGDADDCKKANAEGREAARHVLNKRILEAAEKGPVAAIKANIARGGDPNCTTPDPELFKATALMMALKANRKDEAVALMECGADASIADTRKETALVAASAGHAVAQPNVIDKLLAAGGKIDAATDRGITPVHAAAAFGRTEALSHLLKKCGASLPPKEGEKVPQLEVKTVDGLTPLMKAAQMGQQQSVELLIKFGAEINALDGNVRTALDWAEQTDRKQIVDVIKKANGERGQIVLRKAKQDAQKAKSKPPTGNAVVPGD